MADEVGTLKLVTLAQNPLTNYTKHAVVTPIFKKGDKSDVKNYRPVSLLCMPSKILEKCMFISLYDHYRPFFSDAQFGFRRKRSCSIQLLKYLDYVYQAIENNETVNVIYTDFEKAFDRVDHGILLKKLYQTGTRGKLLTLVQSYLSSRTQQVKVNGVLSASFSVKSGVPQGSILAPLFFLVFINDLPNLCSSAIPLLCADDAKFIGIGPCETSFQNDLTRVFDWSVQHNMPFNIAKCSHISFNCSTSAPPNFTFNGQLISAVNHQLDLGVLVSDNLAWLPHIRKCTSKALAVFFMVRRNSPMLPVQVKLNVYKSMILPIITYSSTCIGLNVSAMRTLENAQRKVCKWIAGTTTTSYRDMLIQLNILPVPYFLQMMDLIMLSKFLNNRVDCDCPYRYAPPTSANTRSTTRTQFQCVRPNKSIAEQNYWYRTLKLANQLPLDVDIPRLGGLKGRLLEWFWSYFHTNYNESSSCTWRVHCDCVLNNCRSLLRH